MKNQILLILCLAASVFANAQIEISGPNGSCNEYQLSYEGSQYVPAWYPNQMGEYPSTPPNGYSYFWYTSDGQISKKESPIFRFRDTDIEITLIVTPRKKGNDPKEQVSRQISVIESTCGDLGGTSSELWTDFEPRPNDKMFLIVPFDKCAPFDLNGKVFYDNSVLSFVRHLPFNGVGPIVSTSIQPFQNVNGNQMNSEILISGSFASLHMYPSVVLEFDVVSMEGPVGCMYSDSLANSFQDREYKSSINSLPYDPNVLTPSLGRDLSDCRIGRDTIFYDLQFQNEGDGNTDSIYVLVNLDDRLDPSSFHWISTRTSSSQIITQSYNPAVMSNFPLLRAGQCTFLPATGNDQICGFRCDDMVLSPMAIDYDASIGYIRFYAIVKEGVVLGPCDSLVTTSEVIFHPMGAVQTNQAVTSCKCETENSFWVWLRCWHKWIIGILLLLFLWCCYGKRRKRLRK